MKTITEQKDAFNVELTTKQLSEAAIKTTHDEHGRWLTRVELLTTPKAGDELNGDVTVIEYHHHTNACGHLDYRVDVNGKVYLSGTARGQFDNLYRAYVAGVSAARSEHTRREMSDSEGTRAAAVEVANGLFGND